MPAVMFRTLAFAVMAAAALGGTASAAHPVAWRDGLEWRGARMSVRALPEKSRGGMRRAYRFSSTAGPGARAQRRVEEVRQEPYMRTGNTLFDGLFALALADARLDRVSTIRDAAFDHGRPIDCVCFETGEKWHYVWTRDISYAIDLGLASLDPQRSFNSLLFKTSGVRAELLSDRLQQTTLIAQDTGSGGSWPVSTDRAVWIMAASDVLDYLPAERRAAAARQVFEAARATVEQDRRYVFDRYAELYRGETSFLDWREQNYPEWTRSDVVSIAAGYALSTNVVHLVALEATARLAAELGAPDAQRYLEWAAQLRRAINARFWEAGTGMYASYLTAQPNAVASDSYDLLGLSLAIIHGVADAQQARSILQRYPVSPAGPPVIWPEQSGIPIYHNRAIWPFVTAYALRASKAARHETLAVELAMSLMRGAALSLSNMENFEFLTLQVRFEDGSLTGPVINSPRQLWSVAGYLSMVQETMWGLTLRDGQLRVDPWLPAGLARMLFAGQRFLSLHDLPIGGATLGITLELPRRLPASGWLEAESLYLNGEKLSVSTLDVRRLGLNGANQLRITMRAAAGTGQPISRIPFADPKAAFAPVAPTGLTAQRADGGIVLAWQGGAPGASAAIAANGQVLAAGVSGERFEDRTARSSGTVCYSVTQRFDATAAGIATATATATATAGRTASLPSSESCVPDPIPGIVLEASDGSVPRVIDGVARYVEWGAPAQELTATFTAPDSGVYRFELEYSNSHGPINTGITAAVKTVSAQCVGAAAQSGSVAMPHVAREGVWEYSTGFMFDAGAGAVCALRVADGFNMSYLEHFALYSGGQGGASGPLNRADIASARIELIGGLQARPGQASTRSQ